MQQVASIRLDTKRLDELIKQMDGNADKAVSAIAFQVEGVAKTLSPIDTGALRNSIHTEKVDDGVYMVADAVEYGIYQELGTHKTAAHPFLVPALERVGKLFGMRWTTLFATAARAAARPCPS